MNKYTATLLSLILTSFLFAQDEAVEEAEKDSLYFIFEPEELTIEVGDSDRVRITLVNQNGENVENPFYIYGRRRAITTNPRLSDSSGVAMVTVKAFKPGSHELSARSITKNREDRVRGTMPVEIPYPPLKSVTFVNPAENVYEGTTVSFKTVVHDEAGLVRKDAVVTLTSGEPRVADFDPFGNLSAKLK